MKNADIHIRDPYILAHGGKYYLYGTRGATTWGSADGFDCYVGTDLENWEGPFEVFHNDGGFWATSSYWAPEVYYYEGAFYFVASFRGEGRNLGIQVLRSESPLGPFTPHSDGPVTPADRVCLDGTLYFENDTPWLVFSHSFEQEKRGGMCILPLTRDLRAAAGEMQTIFYATDAAWPRPLPFAAEMGFEGDVYLSDGPCLYRTQGGKLLMLWSSFGESGGYNVGISEALDGTLIGGWRHLATPLFGQDGGHGMVFTTLNGTLVYTLHSPNDKGAERPAFYRLAEEADGLLLCGRL